MNAATGTLILLVSLAAGDSDLTVLRREEGKTPPNELLNVALKQECYRALDRRREEYEKLKTPEDCIAYQKRMREFFVRQLGGFPKRAPLNARVVGKLSGDGFRVEKVIYESEPRHHVTALMYLPETQPPYPAVLIPCGHSRTGKAAESYQRIAILLAKNGIAALCYDPIGQGERHQMLADKPQEHYRGIPRYKPPHPSVVFISTTEHTLVGVGAILLGSNTARYRIWDGMRSIDYLTSRPDIDPKRIGCTGISGGGTLTRYLMALDDRVACAAPGCFLSTFRRLIDTSGPQDAEQNIFGQIAFGMDEAEYVMMRAPKPTLILAGTRDRTFDITGTWDIFRDAKRFYSRLGFPERVELAEPDVPHGFPMELRVASTRWMRRWLLGVDDAVTEPDFPIFQDEQLLCSPEGQVMLMPDERSVIDLNVEWEKRLAGKRRGLWASATQAEARAKVREVAGVRPLAKLSSPTARNVGSIDRNGYRIEKLVLQSEGGIPIPTLAFAPPKPNNDVYLYLHGKGKHIDADVGGPIEKLVNAGHLVLAVDLSGIGETERTGNRRIGWTVGMLGPDYHEFALAYLLGKSFVGMRAEDTLVSARFLSTYQTDGKRRRVHLIGIGEAAIPALHAAALEPQLFSSVRLRRMIPSWVDVVKATETSNQLINTIHGVLSSYDLPDLVTLYGQTNMTVEDPADVRSQPVRP